MATQLQDITIEPFSARDQAAARRLILDGLVEHWGWLDASKNPDLLDIGASYAGGLFLVAYRDGRLVGTGAYLPKGEDAVQIQRMSVERSTRRHGLGRRILDELCKRAREAGYRRAVLETTETWQEVIAFYLRYGFRITHCQDGDVYFTLDLTLPARTGCARCRQE